MSACDIGLSLARELGEGIHECQALYRRGVIQARKGDLEGGKQTAEELRKTVEGGPAIKRLNYYEGLQALIALRQKETARGQDHLQKALALTPIELGYNYNPRPEFLEFLAEVHEEAGRLEEAQKAYEEIQLLKTPRVYCPGNALIYARSFYKLGKILERKGDKAGAAKNYRQFLDLWKDADPGTQEIEDAKARVRVLGY